MSGSSERGSARGKRPTIVDVARHAQVSPAAVSKVLRNAYGVSASMHARVSAAVEELQYRPMVSARGMRTSTRTLGVSSLDPENPFFSMLLDGVAQQARRSRYSALITLSDIDGVTQVEAAMSMVDRQMDGLILITPTMSVADLERLALAVPLVLLGRHGQGDGYDSVASDDARGAELVVEHLVSRGHRRIVFHTQRVETVGLPETPREQGYRAAMERRGLHPDVVVGEWTRAGGERLAADLMARDQPPTAVHAGADIAALGVLGWMWRHDLRAPTDLAVAACDDVPTADLPPISLTSTDQNAVDMGALATRLLIERIEGRTEPQHVRVTPQLRVRSSS